MASITTITITHGTETSAEITAELKQSEPKQAARALSTFMDAISGGCKSAKFDLQIDGGSSTAASGTLTGTTVIAGNTAVVNGVTFTGVASGATSVQFNIGASDTLTMANVAAAINASTNPLLLGMVSASASGTAVTVTCTSKGALGNSITLASTGGIASSGARLTGGANASANVYNFGLA